MTYDIELINQTAVQKQQNERFEQYLIHTHTEYKIHKKKNYLHFEITTSDTSHIENALNSYIYCTRNGHIAYAS